jgi:hypothetical protein
VLRSLDHRPQADPVPPRARSRASRIVGVLAITILSVVGLLPSRAAAAEPDPVETAPIVFEGGTDELRDQLNLTQEAYLDAKVALDASVARQQELIVALGDIQAEIDDQTVDLGKVAHLAFVSSGYTRVAGIIATGSMQSYLDGAGLIDALATREAMLIRALLDSRAAAAQAQAEIDAEIARQQELEKQMFDRNEQAELALWQAAGGRDTEGFSVSASHVAVAAPRNADGSWPAEYIPRDRSGYPAVQELTVTGNRFATGYITPRTAHAVVQAKEATFTRFVSCYVNKSSGEHPRGRACDFAVRADNVYGGEHVQGEARAYGDQLAQFLVFNAERLGVLYVIWYQQIWLASTGRWKSYSGCCDASRRHTNHVHLSMR